MPEDVGVVFLHPRLHGDVDYGFMQFQEECGIDFNGNLDIFKLFKLSKVNEEPELPKVLSFRPGVGSENSVACFANCRESSVNILIAPFLVYSPSFFHNPPRS